MGFDGMLFARADYADIAKRRKDKTTGMIWQANSDLGSAASIYTDILPAHYGPPPGANFDTLFGSDDPMMDDPRLEGYNVDEKVDQFINDIQLYANWTKTSNVITTMGEDFNYADAHGWFKNLDKLIRYVNMRQSSGSKVNLFYSTPSCYVKAQNEAGLTWSTKSDDFFPYASDPHAFWTGKFMGFKGKLGLLFLQVITQAGRRRSTTSETQVGISKLAVSCRFWRN